MARSHVYHVSFDQDDLLLVTHNAEAFVPIRPLAEKLGLTWSAQKQKIEARFKEASQLLKAPAKDGKLYSMVCLSLDKLPAWLYSVNENNVAPNLRDKIKYYQQHCADTLNQFWQNQQNELNVRDQIAVSRYCIELLDKLSKTQNTVTRKLIKEQLARFASMIHFAVPEEPTFEKIEPHANQPKVLQQFWGTIAFLEEQGEELNHSATPNELALNLPQIKGLLDKYHQPQMELSRVRSALKRCDEPQFKSANRSIYSAIEHRTKKCWVFVN